MPGSDTDREGEPGAMIQLDRVGLRFRNVTNGSPSLKQAVVNALHGRRYEPDAEPFWLYRDLSLRIGHGERIGIIGPNGAGKSTLLKMICGIYRPTRGLIRVRGRIAPLLEMGAGFAAELSGVENVVLTGAIQGFSRRRVLERIDRIMDFAGLDRFRDTPIKYYSSGMMSRLAFATATDLDPEILLVDEVLSAGDAEFIERARSRISELVDASHIMVLVSHSMGAITSMCTRVIWIDSGRVIADGPRAAWSSDSRCTTPFRRTRDRRISRGRPPSWGPWVHRIRHEGLGPPPRTRPPPASRGGRRTHGEIHPHRPVDQGHGWASPRVRGQGPPGGRT